MPTAKVKSILDEFSDMGGIHVTLSGGEVFLHKDIIEIARYCREKDLKITILSNLIALKDEQVTALKELNISLIQVSLYSMNPKIHDFITTVKGSFEKTKTSIEKLVAADIPVQISCPLMKANKVGYDKVLDYAKSLKIKAQTDYIMMARADLDTENLANRLSLEETEQVLRDIIEHDIQYREQTLERYRSLTRLNLTLKDSRSNQSVALVMTTAVSQLMEMFIHVQAGKTMSWAMFISKHYKRFGRIANASRNSER